MASNIGLGFGGDGADIAGEVSYVDDLGTFEVTEILQYTYGAGAVAGGIGRKRLVEFVAYRSEGHPYYRYLHEDSMGNTVTTTDQWGDRRDVYEYTDYGVPIHAPIVLDGRNFVSISPHSTYQDVSVVSLDVDSGEVEFLLVGKSVCWVASSA